MKFIIKNRETHLKRMREIAVIALIIYKCYQKNYTQLTTYTNKTEEQHQKEIQKKVKKSNCKQYKYTQEQMQLFVADLLKNNDGILLLKRLDDDISGAYKIKKVKFDGSKINIEL